MKYVAFIPLRGGSKSIPRKNIVPIAGKPLCHWAIEAAVGCSAIERIYVATDSDEIRHSVANAAFPKVELVDRSPDTATDTASTESAMLEFAESHEFGVLVLIQATSPLLRSDDLSQAIERYERENADSLVTVVPQKRFIWSLDSQGLATAQNYNPLSRPRRQDFPPYYVENGAFYLSERIGLLEHQCRLFGQIAAHVMPEETFYELDERVDWKIIEAFLKERSSEAPAANLSQRASRIKLFLTDVDGVLTDAGMYYSENGDELKKFNTRDGKAFELLRNAGIQTGIITAEDTQIVARRAAKLKMDFLYQGATDKDKVLSEILVKTGFTREEVAYIGDDLGDLPVLEQVGVAACPSDAIEAVQRISHFRSTRKGGEGAVREFAEWILLRNQV